MINSDRLIKTFLDLVKIDSPSGFEKNLAKNLYGRLKNLGGKARIDSYGNVIAKFAGTGEPILLSAHMDTVEPGRGIKPEIIDSKIISDGKTILGGDCKAGIAVILEAIESLTENNESSVPIEVIFTREEETCLGGAKNLDYSKIHSIRGLVFDGEGKVSTIGISSPHYANIDLVIRGESAHAGLEPEKGISAIVVAGHILAKLRLGRVDFETTANIGTISGGFVRNSVPDMVKIAGEIRSKSHKKLKKHAAHLRRTTEQVGLKHPKAKIELSIEEEITGYTLAEHECVHVKAILRKMGLKPKENHSGGLTDANIFRAKGIEAINLGTGNYLPHTKKEYVVIPEMLQAARFCEKAVLVDSP